ncbi:MAG: response regulator, partial [Thermoproteota archaeon]|nr:response regulator [Thermoproteota archaeon]
MVSANQESNTKPMNSPALSSKLNEKFIMVVDDEQDILLLFDDYLRSKGFTVKTFQNPIEALTEFQFAHSSCSLIISDIRMPQMSGLQFIERIGRIDKDVQVIFMTAFDIEKQKINKKNMSEMLKKPIRLEDLLTAVNRV